MRRSGKECGKAIDDMQSINITGYLNCKGEEMKEPRLTLGLVSRIRSPFELKTWPKINNLKSKPKHKNSKTQLNRNPNVTILKTLCLNNDATWRENPKGET